MDAIELQPSGLWPASDLLRMDSGCLCPLADVLGGYGCEALAATDSSTSGETPLASAFNEFFAEPTVTRRASERTGRAPSSVLITDLEVCSGLGSPKGWVAMAPQLGAAGSSCLGDLRASAPKPSPAKRPASSSSGMSGGSDVDTAVRVTRECFRSSSNAGKSAPRRPRSSGARNSRSPARSAQLAAPAAAAAAPATGSSATVPSPPRKRARKAPKPAPSLSGLFKPFEPVKAYGASGPASLEELNAKIWAKARAILASAPPQHRHGGRGGQRK